MQQKLRVLSIAITVAAFTSCNTEIENQDTSAAIIASETGIPASLPADVLSVTKPLMSGELYSKPDFKSPALTHFDSTQQIQLLDTTDVMFMKARISKNSETYTGYISKAILPELQ